VLHNLIQDKHRTYQLKKYVLKTELIIRASTLKESKK
jgi:hypothetical protein